jgi:hypothetical protein
MLIIHNIKLNCYINFAMEIPIEIDRKANNQNPEPILPITDVRLNDERVKDLNHPLDSTLRDFHDTIFGYLLASA